jgi:hypothetical protein
MMPFLPNCLFSHSFDHGKGSLPVKFFLHGQSDEHCPFPNREFLQASDQFFGQAEGNLLHRH